MSLYDRVALSEEAPIARFSRLDDARAYISKTKRFLKQRHKFIRIGRFGGQSKIGLDPEFMASKIGSLYNPMAGETDSHPTYYERGLSVYFADPKGGGYAPRDPIWSRASYGAKSGYWQHMISNIFAGSLASGDVFLLEASLIPTSERVDIELEYPPSAELAAWRAKYTKREIDRRSGYEVEVPPRASRFWHDFFTKLGAVYRRMSNGLMFYYMPSMDLWMLASGLVAKYPPETTRREPREMLDVARSARVPAPKEPDFGDERALPEMLPTYETGSDGEPVVERPKIITRLDATGDNHSLPRLYLPGRMP